MKYLTLIVIPMITIRLYIVKSVSIQRFSSRRLMHMSFAKPLFKFGLVADIQYVNAPDGSNFQKTKIRKYRQSLQIFKSAVQSWNALFDESFKFSIVLGDTLDGQTALNNSQDTCLQDITNIMINSHFQFHFCCGNHDFYAFNRSQIFQKIIPKYLKDDKLNTFLESVIGGLCTPQKLYYDFCPYPGYRCIVMDSYDVSLIGASSTELRELAMNQLSFHNPNNLSVSGTWFNNLPFEKYRWVPYNGGISKQQLDWLRTVLSMSRIRNENVFMFCHQPIFAPSKPNSLVWNAEEVLGVLHKSGNVRLWMAGHDHDGQYSVDSTGIHHIVPPAPLECGEGELAFGHMEVFPDRLALRWTGKTPSDPDSPWPVDLALPATPQPTLNSPRSFM